MSAKTIKPHITSDNSLTPTLKYHYASKVRVKFTGSCLKQSVTSYTDRKIVNIYIVYELGASTSNVIDPTLKNCLFGTVTLTKNTDFICMDIQVMESDLIENQVVHFQVVVWSKCINFWSRYEFFCSY